MLFIKIINYSKWNPKYQTVKPKPVLIQMTHLKVDKLATTLSV